MAERSCRLLDRSNVKLLLDSIDTILTDCDGVIYHMNSPIPGVADVIHKLKILGKRVFYITNNSNKTRADLVKSMASMGYPALENDVISAAYVTAQYLKDHYKYRGTAYCIGNEGLAKELETVGITSIGVGPDLLHDGTLQEFKEKKPDPKVKCVVVGLDQHFNYVKAGRAMSYLRNKDCLFVTTNPDATIPIGGGLSLPCAGSIIAMIAKASGRVPDIICGKPNSPMFDTVMSKYNVDPTKTLMIGDRLDTDIVFAGRYGLQSMIVLSGVTTLDDVEHLQRSKSLTADEQFMIPDFYLPSLAELGPLLN